ncbi:hypothetical protein [Xanthocytophaga agilis]|uniref:Uncharacterized protein n=1 Tax=Xanthocytophaga agilis TaxID=3048010 RepID=A0AAE3UEZ5_9BACT|nr:hypothetical protein [Xanthocytophaga agilis]MDJ1502740.1 hypothetical protein [Xanthocytophaga agilis]
MSNVVIDSKTDNTSVLGEKIITTLSLILTSYSPASFGIDYDVQYSGPFGNGHQKSTQPTPLTGNGQFQISNSPQVIVTVSNFTPNNATISVHINVTVKKGLISKSIFDNTLAGSFSNTAPFSVFNLIANNIGESAAQGT